MNHPNHGNEEWIGFTLALPFAIAIIVYFALAIAASHHYKPFPMYRYLFWLLGILCGASAVVGPLANRAHTDFTAHMIIHLLLGMLAPLLLTLAAPMTLLLRTLSLKQARRLSRILKSGLFRFLIDPIVSSTLNIGGLWFLYTTDIFNLMHQNLILHILVHIHLFLAGYLFTASMIYIDPTAHRTSFVYRTLILLISFTGHGLLSKYIYANPPTGVPAAQAEIGGMIMYYGGDIIDIILISILFFQWYQATRPRSVLYQIKT